MKQIKKVKTICFCLFWCISGVVVHAGETEYSTLTLEQILPAETAGNLRASGRIHLMHSKQKVGQPVLCPDTGLKSHVLAAVSDEHWQNVYVSESLYFLEKEKPVPRAESLAAIAVTSRSLGKMQGIEYYSNSRKRKEILYPQAYTVNNPEQRLKIPDNITGPTDKLVLYCFQEDATFGKSIYRLNYYQENSGVVFHSVNLDPLYMSFIRIANPETLQLTLMLTDVADGVLMYAMTMVKVVALPGLADFIKKSYESRTDALFVWFSTEYTAGTEE